MNLESVCHKTMQIVYDLGIHGNNMMGANFIEYSREIGIRDFEDYVLYARYFYEKAVRNPEEYTIVITPEKNVVIDFQGTLRGFYDRHGNPYAFFKPDYYRMGYQSRAEEFLQFKIALAAMH